MHCQCKFELDFYIPDRRLAVQVAYDLSSAETLRREIKALDLAAERLPIDQALIITYNTLDTLKIKKLTVEVLPTWRWVYN